MGGSGGTSNGTGAGAGGAGSGNGRAQSLAKKQNLAAFYKTLLRGDAEKVRFGKIRNRMIRSRRLDAWHVSFALLDVRGDVVIESSSNLIDQKLLQKVLEKVNKSGERGFFYENFYRKKACLVKVFLR